MGVPDGLRDALADRYALERELGRGGMAIVYLAQDLRHDRPVALKVLLPELAATLGPERFQREIRLAARLQHPHILTVHDSGEAAGQLWFTMPYVEGESLRDRLRRERQLPVDDALRIAREAAPRARLRPPARRRPPRHQAREHPAHQRRQHAGRRLRHRPRRSGGDDGLTQTGLAIGTPAYMSPEQAAGDKALDARTDIYSLASVLYEMLAGEPPFTGPTAQAIIAKRLTEPVPSVRAARPDVPAAVDQAIRRALAPVAGGPVRHRGAVRPGAARRRRPARPAATARADAASPPPPAPAPRRRRAGRRRRPGRGRRPHRRPPHRRRAAVRLAAHARAAPRRRAAPSVVAVLPFENLGDSADAYFADGVTDEVRSKLGAGRGPRGHRPRQLEPVPAHHQAAAGDRARAGRRLPADRHGAVGEGRAARAGCG